MEQIPLDEQGHFELFHQPWMLQNQHRKDRENICSRMGPYDYAHLI